MKLPTFHRPKFYPFFTAAAWSTIVIMNQEEDQIPLDEPSARYQTLRRRWYMLIVCGLMGSLQVCKFCAKRYFLTRAFSEYINPNTCSVTSFVLFWHKLLEDLFFIQEWFNSDVIWDLYKNVFMIHLFLYFRLQFGMDGRPFRTLPITRILIGTIPLLPY